MQKHRMAVAATWVVSAAFPLACQAQASPVSAPDAPTKTLGVVTIAYTAQPRTLESFTPLSLNHQQS